MCLEGLLEEAMELWPKEQFTFLSQNIDKLLIVAESTRFDIEFMKNFILRDNFLDFNGVTAGMISWATNNEFDPYLVCLKSLIKWYQYPKYIEKISPLMESLYYSTNSFHEFYKEFEELFPFILDLNLTSIVTAMQNSVCPYRDIKTMNLYGDSNLLISKGFYLGCFSHETPPELRITLTGQKITFEKPCELDYKFQTAFLKHYINLLDKQESDVRKILIDEGIDIHEIEANSEPQAESFTYAIFLQIYFSRYIKEFRDFALKAAKRVFITNIPYEQTPELFLRIFSSINSPRIKTCSPIKNKNSLLYLDVCVEEEVSLQILMTEAKIIFENIVCHNPLIPDSLELSEFLRYLIVCYLGNIFFAQNTSIIFNNKYELQKPHKVLDHLVDQSKKLNKREFKELCNYVRPWIKRLPNFFGRYLEYFPE